jgi:hypothetical protein
MQQNNGQSGMIRPGGGVGVSVPNLQGQLPIAGARTGMLGATPMLGQPMDPMAMFRQMVDGGTAAMGGGIKWESYGSGGVFDQGMQEILNSSGPDQDSMQYHASQVVQINVIFMQHLISRSGKFYEVYRQTVESFRRNEQGHPCPVRDAFITMFSRHQEFNRPVAIAAAPLFGWRLINIRQETGREELNSNQYLSAAEVAIRSILFMEMVNWLMKTPEGNVHARQLPKDLAIKMPNLENYSDVISSACAVFGINNPYAGIKWEIKAAVRSDLTNNRYESGAEYLYGNQGLAMHGQADFGDARDLFSIVQKNARDYHGNVQHNDRHDPVEASIAADHNWNKIRNDLNNLTPKNKGEFQLSRFFYNIGKPNHYLVTETDWKNIKHAFVKHPEMKKEETVLEGCFRIVIIDLDADSGWFSRIVRCEGYDMPTVLSDPHKLLPRLSDDGGDFLTVETSAVEDVAGLKGDAALTISIETCQTLEEKDKIPVITLKDQILAASSKELESTLINVNQRVSQNFTKVNAVSFNTKVWDTFACAKPEDKVRLFQDLPFLFKDSEMTTRPNFYTAMKATLAYFRQNIIDKELMSFIDSRLTTAINNYFINCAGYDSYPHEAHYLSVDSIVKDYEELDGILERTDSVMFRILNSNDQEHYLLEELKIFTYAHPSKPDAAELSAIEQIKYAQELILERPLYITFINNRGGPIYTDTNLPIQLKRSTFPEYFDLIEKAFDPTMGEEASFDTIDKLVCFTTSDNLWLWSYSAVDKNMATLRHVSRKQPLVLLALD